MLVKAGVTIKRGTGMKTKFKNLVEMQQDSCKKYHDNAMLGEKGTDGYLWMTFGEFGKKVDNLRGGLVSLGIKKGHKIAIISSNCALWPVAAYATYGLSAHFVPMYEAQTYEDWKYIVRDSASIILFVRNKDIYEKVKCFVDEIDTLQYVILMSDDASDKNSMAYLMEVGRKNPVPAMSPDPDEPIGLTYTSGTTGNPKGVVLTHKNIAAEIEQLHMAFHPGAPNPSDRSLSILPWGHLMGQIEEIHLLLFLGYSTAIVRDISEFGNDLQNVQPTILFVVPRVLSRMSEGVENQIRSLGDSVISLFREGIRLSSIVREKGVLSPEENNTLTQAQSVLFKEIHKRFGGNLRMVISGGAALSKEVAEFFDSIGIPVYEGYGLTETSMAISVNTPTARKYGSIGKALPFCKVVLDTSRDSCKEGEGEIIVYCPNNMIGYHNLPEVTAQTMTKDGGVRTGDIGRLDEDGFLFITGRIKELYKLVNGKYIAPGPLEEKIMNSPYVSMAMVHGENQLFNIALLLPDMEALKPYAKEMGVDLTAPNWTAHPKIQALYEGEMNKYCKSFKGFEKPLKFVIISDEWTPAAGFITSTLKLKRRFVVEYYKDVIDRLYMTT